MQESARDQLDRDNQRVREAGLFIQEIFSAAGKIVRGQEELFEGLMIGLLCNGHILIEGVPGLAKTLAAKTFARLFDLDFQRIQFTPDLLPADLTGTPIYHPPSGEFHTRKGPVFTQVLLADEINRAPAKVQSALLEAMEEQQVTLGDASHALPTPFLVLATQNPLEHEGTYPLPEAQLDRFFLKLLVSYPARSEEDQMVAELCAEPAAQPEAIVDAAQLESARAACRGIYLAETLRVYLLDIVAASRAPQSRGLAELQPLISHGVSPRGSLALAMAAKARAFLRGRSYVVPDDITSVARPVLRHRLLLSYEAEAESYTTDELLDQLLNAIPQP